MIGRTLVLGRSPNLVLGFLMAGFNLDVVFQVDGFAPTDVQIGAVNAFLALLVALVANSDTISTAAGNAATIRQNGGGK